MNKRQKKKQITMEIKNSKKIYKRNKDILLALLSEREYKYLVSAEYVPKKLVTQHLNGITLEIILRE